MTFEQGEQPDVSSLELILRVFADSHRLGIVMRLLEEPSTQKELGRLLNINSGTMSRHMSVLEDANLVTRKGSHSPYSLVARPETLGLLLAAAELSVAATGAHLEMSTTIQGHLEGLDNPSAQQ